MNHPKTGDEELERLAERDYGSATYVGDVNQPMSEVLKSNYLSAFKRGYRAAQSETELLRKRVQKLREALEFVADKASMDTEGNYACTFCDMGGSGYSSKGDGHHDDIRYVCPVAKAREALAADDKASEGGEL